MTDRAVLVLHGSTPVGAALAAGLGSWGTRAVPIDAGPGRGALGPALRVAAAAFSPLAVVLPVLAGVDRPNRPFAELDEADWVAEVEAPLRAVADALVVAREVTGHGGAIILVGPTAATEGGAGHATYAAAAEGARLLARSCAQAWDPDEVAVHWVSVATGLLLAPSVDAGIGRAIAGAVHGLLDPALRSTSGTTVVVRVG